MAKIIELRPEKKFINKDFEKYQYSTDRIDIGSPISLEEEVYRIEPSSDQASLLEAKLFAFYNHLVKNPYDTSCWFIGKQWGVWRLNDIGILEQIHVLHSANENLSNLRYNPSITFVNDSMTVISDGGITLRLLSGSKDKDVKVYRLENLEPGVLLDAKYFEAEKKLTVAQCSIVCNNDKKCTNVQLLSYVHKQSETLDEDYVFLSKEVLQIQGSLEYLYISNDATYLHTIAQDSIAFENSSHAPSNSTKTTSSSQTIGNKSPKYCWSQDADSLTVWINVEEKDEKKIKVITSATELSVVFANNVIVQGECFHRLEENLTTWKFEKDRFRIDLAKQETGLMWNVLVKGDSNGEYIPNESLVAEIHARLAHLCSEQGDVNQTDRPCLGFNSEQLEECDLEGKDNLLQRVNLTTQETTHTAMLGANNHVLFTYKTTSGQIICLRHDHDACVWITKEADANDWTLNNICVFPGLGYVEASKSNKKYCVSPIDASYVAVLEHKRHIFIYEKPKSDAKIAKQWIVDLGAESSPIVGAVAMNKYLVVLTKNVLHHLQIYS